MSVGFLVHEQFIFFIEKKYAKFMLPFNITIPKNSHIENLDSPIYNCQSYHWIQPVIKILLEMADFSISKMMVI